MDFAHCRGGQPKPIRSRRQQIRIPQLVSTANVKLRNSLTQTCRRFPSRYFNIVQSWRRRYVTKSISDQFTPTEWVMMIHLKMKLRPTLKTASGEMKIYRMTPKCCFTISWPVNLCLTFSQSLKNFPSSSRVNAPLAKQTSKNKICYISLWNTNLEMLTDTVGSRWHRWFVRLYAVQPYHHSWHVTHQ